MLDKVFIKAPAKINLFLRIMNQRPDGYHNIRSGVTFLDLYDEVSIEVSDTNSLTYSGPFKPHLNIFDNDIIIKTLDLLNLKQNIKLKLNIKKNIPFQAGLGSASTNAASLIKGLNNLGIINKKDNKFLSSLGSDVPACFYGDDCIVTGKGDKIHTQVNFPKYYFVLVKPNIQLSTHDMYAKIKYFSYLDQKYNDLKNNINFIHENDSENDFEKIVRTEYKNIKNLLDYLSSTKDNIFVRMTGSGSCCYATFKKKEQATKAINDINYKFSDFWSYLGQNNVI